jgi:hypothetical protein
MEAFLIFDSHNNLISTKYNKQFSHYLIECANKNGLKLTEEYDVQDINNNETLRNFLSVLLTPFIASQRYLMDCSNITFDCIENSKAVFSKVIKITFHLIDL